MRIKMLLLMILALCLFAPVHAQSTPAPTPYADLEPITLDNAKYLVQLPGELTGVSEGFDVSPDGKQVAVARPDGVYLYDMGSFETPAKIFEVSGADLVYGPTFSPDGTQISVTFFGESIKTGSITRLWDIQSGDLIQDFGTHPWPLDGGASFSPDGHFIAGNDTPYYNCPGSCDPASSMHIWEINGAEKRSLFNCPIDCIGRYGIGSFVFTPDSQTLLWSSYDYAMPSDPLDYNWRAIDLSPDETNHSGKNLAALPGALGDHFDNQTGPFAGEIDSLWFSPDGTLLKAHNAEDGSGSLWDVEIGTLKLSLLPGMSVGAFLPDNTLLVTYEDRHTAVLLQIDTGRQATLFENLGEQEYISAATPEGKLLTGYVNRETVHFYGVPAESKSTL